jgi:hypothetical protein
MALKQRCISTAVATRIIACCVSVAGIGPVLATVILLETGDIGRFAYVGNYASYCRCVESAHISNGKKKG